MPADDHATIAPAGSGERYLQGLTASGLRAFNDTFHRLVDEGQLAGVVTLVARRGDIVNFDAYGVLDVSADPTVAVRRDSIFRLASMTKPVIGAAMMMLWEEGRWGPDDPVARHIPAFEGLQVKRRDGALEPQASPMTMRQLMSHTAGFGRQGDYADAKLRDGDLQAMIDRLARLPLAYQPGTEWRYSPSVDIQGYVVEQLSGQSLDVFLAERLFGPLGMEDTGFWV
ncbi:MAG TPA: serine hydrolase domain-containing protein, partial [Caulobacteraceae bacterium]|nr:serine hydrolase domain-containing protein [Caulobacteraceae bacterium]